MRDALRTFSHVNEIKNKKKGSKMKKSRVMTIILGGALFLTSGCVSMIVENQMAKHGYKKATREEMLRPTVPSFQEPKLRNEIKALPKDKLLGKWTCSYVIDTRSSLLSMGYDGPVQTMTSHQTYWFFEDGTCRMLMKMAGKETSWNGKWDYRGGILSISGTGADGKHYSADLKLYWYGDEEFEVRFADLSKYEDMLETPEGIKSANCRYEVNGVLHTQMIISAQGNESAVISVQSPQIYDKDGLGE